MAIQWIVKAWDGVVKGTVRANCFMESKVLACTREEEDNIEEGNDDEEVKEEDRSEGKWDRPQELSADLEK
jgi:hypothetical protein